MQFVGTEGGRQELEGHKIQNQGSLQALDCNWTTYWTATKRLIRLQLNDLLDCNWTTYWTATERLIGLQLNDLLDCNWTTY
jgi:hypothetical protein